MITILTNNQFSRITFPCLQNWQGNNKNNGEIYRNLATKENFREYKLCPSYEPKTGMELCCIYRKSRYGLLIGT